MVAVMALLQGYWRGHVQGLVPGICDQGQPEFDSARAPRCGGRIWCVRQRVYANGVPLLGE